MTGEKWCVVIDGALGPEFDGIPGGPAFGDDGTLWYLAVEGSDLYRVSHPPSDADGE
jgi:hypothetical protein